MKWAEKIRDFLAKKFILPLFESSFSTSQAQKAQNKINGLKHLARILMLGLFGLGGILVAVGSEQKNADVANIGIGILASGLVSLFFLSYESYNARIWALRIRANFLDALTLFIYFNIPELTIEGEPTQTYTFSEFMHLQHRQFHDYYKRNEIVNPKGNNLFQYLSSYISQSQDRIQELFFVYTFPSLEGIFSKQELAYFQGFRNAFQRTQNSAKSNNTIAAIYYFSVYLDDISSMVKYVDELKVLDKIVVTLDENGQATFNRDEFYSSEPNIKFADQFASIRSENYAKMRKNAATNQASSDGQDGE